MIAFVGADSCAALADLHARAFAKPWLESEFTRLLENPAAFAMVSTSPDNHAHGFVLAWTPSPDAEMLTLAVAPEHRRNGLGLALAEAALAAALARGATAMFLEVAEDNLAARALYRKLGFEPSGRRPGYYRRAQGDADALILRRALPRA